MLKQRIVTAIILAALFLAALFVLPVPLFALFMATVVLIAAWEWGNMAGFGLLWQRVLYVVVAAATLWGCSEYMALTATLGLSTDKLKHLLLIGCCWWALALLWVQSYPQSAILWGSRWLRAVIGLVVLAPTWAAFVYLRSLEGGPWLILLVVAVVACADIGGFFFGSKFGKRKLAPAVSPGKSWEGFWGGFACNTLLALGMGVVLGGDAWWVLLAIILPTSLASVLGDLLESMVKRQRGIKDSSQLLPGHGGVLDRIDSLTAAAPVFALALLVSGWRL